MKYELNAQCELVCLTSDYLQRVSVFILSDLLKFKKSVATLPCEMSRS